MNNINYINSLTFSNSAEILNMKNNTLPTKEQANKVFWGLQDRFWMQIIDGKFHQYGSMVFDLGLHKGDIEPGFFKSLQMGCQFASLHLTENLTPDFYKELHRTLCSHFKGDKTMTLMDASQAGIFRTQAGFYSVSDENFFGLDI